MKKSMNFKRVWSLFALVAILVSMFTFTVSAKADIPEIGKQSIVVVSDANGTTYGTGFAVGVNDVKYIITTYTNVGTSGSARVYFNMITDGAGYQATVYDYNQELDIAILELPEGLDWDNNGLVPLSFAKEDSVVDGEPAYIIGYPNFSTMPVPPSAVNPYAIDIIVANGSIKSEPVTVPMMLTRNVRQYTSAGVPVGSLGGPAVNADGEIIGLSIFATTTPGNFILSSSHIIDMCEKNDIAIQIGGGFPWLIVIIIGAVLLVAIIVLVLILVLRKGKKDDFGSSAPITKPLDSSSIPGIPATPAVPSARLIAIGGILNGKKFNLAGSARLGRDASRCAIVYPMGTQGVSALHCEVTFDGNVCYLKDLGSSYGTFTAAGTKLTKDVPVMLRSGDKFYLASPDNTFEIRF